jgi:hypothetical protein
VLCLRPRPQPQRPRPAPAPPLRLAHGHAGESNRRWQHPTLQTARGARAKACRPTTSCLARAEGKKARRLEGQLRAAANAPARARSGRAACDPAASRPPGARAARRPDDRAAAAGLTPFGAARFGARRRTSGRWAAPAPATQAPVRPYHGSLAGRWPPRRPGTRGLHRSRGPRPQPGDGGRGRGARARPPPRARGARVPGRGRRRGRSPGGRGAWRQRRVSAAERAFMRAPRANGKADGSQ